jgi:hypothetical protein
VQREIGSGTSCIEGRYKTDPTQPDPKFGRRLGPDLDYYEYLAGISKVLYATANSCKRKDDQKTRTSGTSIEGVDASVSLMFLELVDLCCLCGPRVVFVSEIRVFFDEHLSLFT